jgi:hypothetical protein
LGLLRGWWWPVSTKLIFDQMAARIREIMDGSLYIYTSVFCVRRFLYILIIHLCFQRVDKKTEGSGLNFSKVCRNSVSSEFLPKSNFDLLLSFQNIWIVTRFKMNCLLVLHHDFDLHSGDETVTYTSFSLCLFVDHLSY